MPPLDPYQLLEVSRQATAAMVQAAYRRKAKTLHPDAGGDPDAFRLLKLAHDVLTDPVRRHLYDTTGEIAEDDSAARRELAQMYTALGDLLVKVIDGVRAPLHQDVLAILRRTVSDHIKGTADGIAANEQLVAKISVAANRIQAKEGENVLRSLLLGREEELNKHIGQLKSDLDLYKKMEVFLEGYEYYLPIETVFISTDI